MIMKKHFISLVAIAFIVQISVISFSTTKADTLTLNPAMSWTRTVSSNSTKTINFSTTNNAKLSVDCGGGILDNTATSFTCTYITWGNYTVSITNPDILTSISGLTRAGLTSFWGGNASNLQGSLSLSYNQISQLAIGAFTKMTKLSGLEMDNNQITSIDDWDLWGLTQLSELNISWNQVSTISANAFKGLTTLGNLHLEANNLTTLDANTFKDQVNLTYVELDRNNFYQLPANLFDNQSSQSFSTDLRGNCMDPKQKFNNSKVSTSRMYNQGVCAYIVYDVTTPTTGNVVGTVVLVGGSDSQRSQISIGNVSHTWTQNGSRLFDFSQAQGAWNLVRTQIVGTVTWIIDDTSTSTGSANNTGDTSNNTDSSTNTDNSTNTWGNTSGTTTGDQAWTGNIPNGAGDASTNTGSSTNTGDNNSATTTGDQTWTGNIPNGTGDTTGNTWNYSISYVGDPTFVTSGGYYNNNKTLTVTLQPDGLYFTITDYANSIMQIITFSSSGGSLYIRAKQYPDNTIIPMQNANSITWTIDQTISIKQIWSMIKVGAEWFTPAGSVPINIVYGANLDPYIEAQQTAIGAAQYANFYQVWSEIYVSYTGTFDGKSMPTVITKVSDGVLLSIAQSSTNNTGDNSNISSGTGDTTNTWNTNGTGDISNTNNTDNTTNTWNTNGAGDTVNSGGTSGNSSDNTSNGNASNNGSENTSNTNTDQNSDTNSGTDPNTGSTTNSSTDSNTDNHNSANPETDGTTGNDENAGNTGTTGSNTNTGNNTGNSGANETTDSKNGSGNSSNTWTNNSTTTGNTDTTNPNNTWNNNWNNNSTNNWNNNTNNVGGSSSFTSGGGSTSANWTPHVEDYEKAYGRCSENGLTSAKTFTEARMSDGITRAEMAKLVSIYVSKFMDKKVESTKAKCSQFSDLNKVSWDLQWYITESCNLGLMGYWANGIDIKPAFSPNEIITRAEVAVVLSRMLRNETYVGTEKYWYQNHLQALKKAWIILDNLTPMSKEIRWDVFAMLSRIDSTP